MSDALSNDSEPESHFDWKDFNEEDKNDFKSTIAGIRRKVTLNKKPAILKT